MQTLVQLYQPHTNQKKVHDSINFEPYKYYVLDIGRQWGKTMLAMNQVFYWAINNSGSKIGWVSPVYKQSEKVYDEMCRAFGKSVISTNSQKLTIEINGSVIQFFSAERYDNIRGFTFDYLVCDEFAFMAEEAWTEVLRATVLIKGKKVLLISTPRGKNHFYNLYNLDGVNSQYKSFKMTSYDGLANHLEIDGARMTLPEHVFKQEYLAEFLDSGAGVFQNLITNTSPRLSKNNYAGIDLGRADDYTVLTIVNDVGQMVYCERWRQNTWNNILNAMLPALKKYTPTCYIEINSIGDVLFEQLKELYDNIQPFTTTSKSKTDLIETLQIAVQNEDFSILDIDWLKKEFDLFTYEYNPKTRNVKYSAPNGFHDDGVISTCLAYKCYKDRVTNKWNYQFA